ncbi:MAG TPA: AI-2E family transporter [Gemmatimonadales bacterium]
MTRATALEDKVFLVLVVLVTVAFAWILRPFFGAVLWGVIIAIVFAPLYRRLLGSMRGRRTLASLATLAIILVVVILPITSLATLLVQEAVGVYERVQSGDLHVGRYFQQVFAATPAWIRNLMDRVGLTSLVEVQDRLSAGLTQAIQFVAAQALNIGQNAASFVVSLFIMLYLLFFLLRDGESLLRRIRAAIPLRPDQQGDLARRFTIVVRATVKGTIIVALVQGALGALIFWFLGIPAPVLWGALMAVLSLLPAIGAGLVWLPVAVYFLATGSIWQGVLLTVYGVLVIGLVDNILRPILVGKDTRIPDYVILISTLGGIAVFGLNGFVVGPLIAAIFIAVWDMVASQRTSVGAEPAALQRGEP